MRSIARFALLPVALFALACAKAPASEDLSAELRRDLELASGVGLELASAQDAGQVVVSAIEMPPAVSPRRAPDRTNARKAPPERVEAPAAGSAERDQIANAPSPEPEVADATPEPVPDAVIATRPTPVQVNFPAEDARGSGGIGGGVIGVVIRGGGTGIDLCERHPRRGGARPPILINRRFPGHPAQQPPFPATGSTFPRR